MSSDGASDAYISARNEAISSLEHATKFFIFTGENDFSKTSEHDIFPKQKECSLYFSKIVDSMAISNTVDNLLFVNESNWLEAVKEASATLSVHYTNFTLVRDFFVSSLDKNYNSSIDRSELTAVYEQAIKSGQSLDMEDLKVMVDNEDTEVVNSLSLTIGEIGNDTCTYDIDAKVADFFVLYDSNGDDLVYLDELLKQVPTPEYPADMCSGE